MLGIDNSAQDTSCAQVCPHRKIFGRIYVDPDFARSYRPIQASHPDWCQTQMEHMNFSFRQAGHHRFAYDYETLEKVLLKVGFHKICRRDHDPAWDSPERIGTGLYVVAQKPP